MTCRFLTGKQVLACTVSKDVYVPSLSELDEYCRSVKSMLCPLRPRGAESSQSIAPPARSSHWPLRI